MISALRSTLIVFSILFSTSVVVSAQTISTIAGNGATGFMSGSYGGDGGPATAALLFYPVGLAHDATGNLYIADSRNGRIRKIDAAGTITTFAGTTIGYSGDGGPATAAQLTFPESIAFDAAGNLYVADRGAPSIRKVTPAGVITTVAGNGTFGFAGDGGPATAALLDNPSDVKIDAAGNIYICDWINGRLRKVDAAGNINTIAGNGTYAFTGDGGPATAAGMRPSAIVLGPAGTILMCDAVSNRLRKIDAAGIITTFAGTGAIGYGGEGGPATAATFRYPSYLLYDASGNLIVCDKNNSVVRSIDAAGIITTLAGIGDTAGYTGDGGPATAALFRYPPAMTFDPGGNLLISDLQNNRVRKVTMPSATGISQATNNPINIYPNPASDVLHIDGLTADTRYTITNVFGKTVLHGFTTSNTLSVKPLAQGMYFLQLGGTGRQQTFIKE